jgi:hypothetical protein
MWHTAEGNAITKQQIKITDTHNELSCVMWHTAEAKAQMLSKMASRKNNAVTASDQKHGRTHSD